MKKTAASNDSNTKKKASKKLSPEELRNLFEERLHEMYWCENKLATLLPDFANRATSYELTAAILALLAVTENQIIRLIHVFDAIGERAVGNKCLFIDQILKNHDFENSEPGFDRDTQIIKCAQKITAYQMESYQSLYEYAQKLDEELAVEFLATAIKEELNAHSRLSEMSLSSIYFDAAS